MTCRDYADRAAIRSLLLDYARAVDAKDLAAVAACFLADAEYEGSLGVGTIADALATLRIAMRHYTDTLHHMQAQSIHLNGDCARSETRCIAHHLLDDDGTTRSYVVAVRYRDDLVRTAAGWKIRRRAVTSEWTRWE